MRSIYFPNLCSAHDTGSSLCYASNRLPGTIHAVAFGGFSPPSLAQRMEASRSKVIMTASCGIEGNKGPIGYRHLNENAIKKRKFKPQKVIVWQSEQLQWDPITKEAGERNWQRLAKSSKNRCLKAAPVVVKCSGRLYIIYTSGKLHSNSISKVKHSWFFY